MKKVLRNRWIQFYIPITFLLFVFFTVERIVKTDGGPDRFYGFPLTYITNSYALSFHYDVFVLPLFFDLVCYMVVVIGIFYLINRIKKLPDNWFLSIVGLLICILAMAGFYITTIESSFYWTNTMYFEKVSWRICYF